MTEEQGYYMFNLQKSFELKADSKIPAIFKDVKLNKGSKYVWGVASNSDMDAQGERVKMDTELATSLERAPYNKLYLEHDHSGANSGGIGSIGLIRFSKFVSELDNQHIILAELNDAHKNINSLWGSVQNGNVDSFSVCGKADRKLEFNSLTGKTERIAHMKDLRETSLTSMPANASAGVLGTFIAKNQMEAIKMEENNNFITMETYTKDMGEIKDGIKALTDTVGKNAESMKGIHENFTNLQKDLDAEIKKDDEDEENKEGDSEESKENKEESTDNSTDENTEENKEEGKEAKAKTPSLQKQLDDTNKELVEIKKAMTKRRVGVSHDTRLGDDFVQKSGTGKVSYEPVTPIMDMIQGGS